MRTYQLTEQAQADIEEILDYIAERMENLDGAKVVLDYLHTAMQEVAEDPQRGHSRRDLTDRPVKFYRKSKEHKYYILYYPDAQPVLILRVASIRRDFVSLLQ